MQPHKAHQDNANEVSKLRGKFRSVLHTSQACVLVCVMTVWSVPGLSFANSSDRHGTGLWSTRSSTSSTDITWSLRRIRFCSSTIFDSHPQTRRIGVGLDSGVLGAARISPPALDHSWQDKYKIRRIRFSEINTSGCQVSNDKHHMWSPEGTSPASGILHCWAPHNLNCCTCPQATSQHVHVHATEQHYTSALLTAVLLPLSVEENVSVNNEQKLLLLGTVG